MNTEVVTYTPDSTPFAQPKFIKTGKGRPRAGTPYKMENGFYGCYLPTNFFGMLTQGNKKVITLKTKVYRLACERIEALGLVAQLSDMNTVEF